MVVLHGASSVHSQGLTTILDRLEATLSGQASLEGGWLATSNGADQWAASVLRVTNDVLRSSVD